MHADSYLLVGTTHRVCEDYTRSGKVNGKPFNLDNDGIVYALVSDGCSASPDTDFGSRFLCLAAEDRVRVFGQAFDPSWCLWKAAEMVGRMLPEQSLDATLLALIAKEGAPVVAVVVGDGVVAGRRKDGTYEVWNVEYLPVPELAQPGPAPGYVSYILDPNRLKQYVALGYNKRRVTHYVNGEVVGTEDSAFTIQVPDAGVGATTYDGLEFALYLDPENYDFLAVLSDGAVSFQERDERGHLHSVPLLDVLGQLLAIKGHKGEFVTRRCNRFFGKFCVENRWANFDDLSMAAIWLGD